MRLLGTSIGGGFVLVACFMVRVCVPAVVAAGVEDEIPLVVQGGARYPNLVPVLEDAWKAWSQWMERRYPRWWDRAQREFPQPWGRLVVTPEGSLKLAGPDGRTRLMSVQPPLDTFHATEALVRLWLYHSASKASTWWREATVWSLLRQFFGARMPVPEARPVDLPVGLDHPDLAHSDALLLDWLEQLDPDEWLTNVWSGLQAPGTHGLDPIWSYLTDHGQAWSEWVEGFFLHWAGQRRPGSSAKELGERSVRPLAALALDLKVDSAGPGALTVTLYFDRDIRTRLWILGFSDDGEVRYYPVALDGNYREVILPRKAHSAYRLLLVHTDRSPWAQPLQVRWNLESRADLPVVLTDWRVETEGDHMRASWETAQERETLQWWVERWDPVHKTWQAVHPVGIPAAGSSFFPLSYHVVMDRSGTATRFRLRCQLRSGIAWTVAEWPPDGEF